MFGRLGWAEILIILVLLLILFGSHKIPGMMKNVADGIKVFKKELKQPTNVKRTNEKKVVAKVKKAKGKK